MTRAKSAPSRSLESHRTIPGFGPCTAMWPPENTDVTAFSFGDSVYVTEFGRPVFVADAHLAQARQSGFTVYGSTTAGHTCMTPPASSYYMSWTSPMTGRVYIGSNDPQPREIAELDVPFLTGKGWKESGPRSSPLAPTEPITMAEFQRRARAAQEKLDGGKKMGGGEVIVTGQNYRIVGQQ